MGLASGEAGEWSFSAFPGARQPTGTSALRLGLAGGKLPIRPNIGSGREVAMDRSGAEDVSGRGKAVSVFGHLPRYGVLTRFGTSDETADACLL
jgi:hypothetical protein